MRRQKRPRPPKDPTKEPKPKNKCAKVLKGIAKDTEAVSRVIDDASAIISIGVRIWRWFRPL